MSEDPSSQGSALIVTLTPNPSIDRTVELTSALERGIKAVIVESFERIHRSNLVGMGVLPLQFLPGENVAALGLTGEETFAWFSTLDLAAIGGPVDWVGPEPAPVWLDDTAPDASPSPSAGQSAGPTTSRPTTPPPSACRAAAFSRPSPRK